MQEPGIYRKEITLDSNFTIIPNAWLRESTLSVNAKMLLFYLLSHQVGYELRDPQIIRESGLGRHALRSARDELVDAGWLILSRTKHEDNTLGTYRYELTEARGYFSPVESSPVERSPDENRPHLRRPINKNTNNKKTIKRVLPPDWQPDDSLFEDEKYGVIDVGGEAQKFMDWHLARGSKFVDWDAAFRNWLKKALDFYAEKHYKESEREKTKRELDAWIASLPEEDK